jgi:hypothetical protein
MHNIPTQLFVHIAKYTIIINEVLYGTEVKKCNNNDRISYYIAQPH